ncbi:hypothetical protein [Niastella yeongjuensis]|nr:hypothetical protein [Niastella yeongjuensis]SEN96908.1 hypothetical protein SAMN05660816_01751 [Niastella yeongjuensis]
MTITDLIILSKKIAVGILVFLIPLAIIAGGLWLANLLIINR